MGNINWEYLKDNFAAIMEDISPYFYDHNTVFYSKNLEELKNSGNQYLLKNYENDLEEVNEYVEFNFNGEGYYVYSRANNNFTRIDKVLEDEITSAISASRNFVDSFWGVFDLSPLMEKIISHIKENKE